MPLDWDRKLSKNMEDGFKVPTITGGKFLQVSSADDAVQYILKIRYGTSTLERVHFEKAVQLIEEGLISTDPGLFVEDYMLYVSNHRATSVAHIMCETGLHRKYWNLFRPLLIV